MSKTIVVDHLARVEGHGGITVELDGAAVSSVRFEIFEGSRLLEALIRGRPYGDVSQIVSRICSICSVAHALTSIKATESAFGVEVTPQTVRLRELLFRGESIESHALHLFLLAAPDYLGYPSAIALAGDMPDAVKLGLRLKKLGNSIQEAVGGRAVHPVNAVVGGFGSVPGMKELVQLRGELHWAAGQAATVLALVAGLPAADFCDSDTVYAALESTNGYAYYGGDAIVVARGGERHRILTTAYRTLTSERTVEHSHAKHSSFEGRPFMVGALARLTVNGSRLPPAGKAALERLGLTLPSRNPMDNNAAQAVELVADIGYALELVESMIEAPPRREAPAPVVPRAGTGTAVTEAPRGLLVHSYEYDAGGRIVTADVITPTAMNASSVEAHFRDAVERSTDRSETALARKLEMIARAYDPCISCSVHVVQTRDAR
jgi:sulfhydrogenase subunit alpha